MSDTRHRADDDIEALSSGTYRTPNGELDLLDASASSLNSDATDHKTSRVSFDVEDTGDGFAPPSPKTNKLDKQARLEARLAKRTSKVMSAYKNYLAQIEVEPDSDHVPSIGEKQKRSSTSESFDQDLHDSLASIEVGRTPFRDYKPYSDNESIERAQPYPSATEYKDGLVQRSWAYRREYSTDPPGLEHNLHHTHRNEDTFLDYEDIRQKFGIEVDDNQQARITSYKYPLFHSRRVRRGLLLIVVASILIGVVTGAVKAKKKASLPDWEAELAEMQKSEQSKHEEQKQQKHEEGTTTAQVSHDGEVMSAKPPPSDNAEAIVRPPEVEEVASTENSSTPISPYKEIANKFKPVAFDRSKGWDGQTYAEAVEFCNELENHSLCPYAAICPLGPSSKPAGGYKSTGSWLAISDEQNGWVHLGSIDSCTKYEETYASPPDWGITGKEETTKNIICCQITAESPKVTVSKDLTTASDNTAEESPLTDNAPVQSSLDVPLTDEEKEQIQIVSSKLQPIYYNRSHGWEGQTYSEALEFCAGKDSRVPCPYTAVCPNGKGRPPLGGVRDSPKGTFVPIIDSPNSWVQLSSKGVCELHSSLYGSPPEWGLTGEGNEEMTRNIVCCKEPTESFEANEGATSQQATSNSSPAEVEETGVNAASAVAESSSSAVLTSAEQSVLDIMHPLWFGRKHGYQGTTYDDAVEFCKNVGGMKVCPIEAYCPNGPNVQNRPPLFLEMDAFDGEQWAPTSAHSNSWILVGMTDGDVTSMCKTHEDLYGGTMPSWGEDGSFTHLKENIMCCVNPSYTSGKSATDTVDTDSSPEMDSQNAPTTAVAASNAIDLEKVMQDQLKPLWLGEAEGWTGGSHDDAMAYCQTIRGKKLCPYSAYCPHGAGQPVMGRHKVDFNAEGELYAPVFGSENHWVMIGQKGENSATTCMSHYQLEGSNPEWGLTSDRPELKKYVMCCTMNSG